MSVTVGWIDGGNTRGEFTASIARLCAYETAKQRLRSVARLQFGPLVCEGRNMLVEQFLQTEAEWLFMVDTDMVFDYDAVERLLQTAEEYKAPVVGGLAFGLNLKYGQFPTLYKEQDGLPVVWLDYPHGQVVQVAATGAAFTLTRRDVFTDYRRNDPHPWFHRIETAGNESHPGGFLGEDLSWCWHLTAKGVPIFVDTRVEAGHVKPTVIDSESYRSGRAAR